MADFLSDFGSAVGDRVLPDGNVLNRKIDFQREKFLKGVSSTKHGKKEDPTYLHFKFIFDFGDNSLLDQETFLAPSPLFRGYQRDSAEIAASSRSISDLVSTLQNQQTSPEELARIQRIISSSDDGFKTDLDFFYGSKSRINGMEGFGFFPTGDVAYMGAQQFMYQRSQKRFEMLKSFKNGLAFINKECPYYFKTLTGLDTLLKNDIPNYFKKGGAPKRAGTLTIDCMESIDMRIFGLSELYRKAVYDFTYHRTMLPENLRKFRMWIVITELRNIQLSYGINDILNPFSIPAVAQAANFLDSFNTQTGLLNNTEGLLQRSTNNEQPGTDRFGTYEMGPYAFVYQLDQCEFDFDDTFPSYTSIDNQGGSAVATKFKIHVGKAKDYKIQFNQLADVLKKEDNIQQMVISDTWGNKTSEYNNYDYTGTEGLAPVDLNTAGNPAEFFAQMASNFINNSVADLANQGISVVQGAVLGNIYGFGGFNVQQATSSVQSLISTIDGGIPNPFADNTPQAQGLGGPKERQYPTIDFDVYPGNPSQASQTLGNVLPTVEGNNALSGDVYGNSPGSDLGLPDRQYPTSEGDEFPSIPGSDLGVPARVYPEPGGDQYPNAPGPDLGLPDRQYPTTSDDVFGDVPGADLGVPGRVYPTPGGDQYPTAPGADLGLPDRQYPKPGGDEYPDGSTPPNSDLGSVYGDQQIPEYKKPEQPTDEYLDVPGQDLGGLGRVYDVPDEDVYPQVPAPLSQYKGPDQPRDEFMNVPGSDLGGIDRVYEAPQEDVYPGVPAPLSEYKQPGQPRDEYLDVPGIDLGPRARVYEVPEGDSADVYDNVPENEYKRVVQKEYEIPFVEEVKNLGKVYPEPIDPRASAEDTKGALSSDTNYANLAGASQDAVATVLIQEERGDNVSQNPLFIGDVYSNIQTPEQKGLESQSDRDVYQKVPGDQVQGSDLGVPFRVYPTPDGDVYPSVPGTELSGSELGPPGRLYPPVNDDAYPRNPGEQFTDSVLGAPSRVYPEPNEDVYKKVPGNSIVGSDLGVPYKNYPPVGADDAYPSVPGTPQQGSDLGAPNRVYPTINPSIILPNDPVVPTSEASSKILQSNYADVINVQQQNAPAPTPLNLGRVYPRTDQ